MQRTKNFGFPQPTFLGVYRCMHVHVHGSVYLRGGVCVVYVLTSVGVCPHAHCTCVWVPMAARC